MFVVVIVIVVEIIDSSEASPQTDEITSQVRRRSFARKLDTFVKFLRNKDAQTNVSEESCRKQAREDSV